MDSKERESAEGDERQQENDQHDLTDQTDGPMQDERIEVEDDKEFDLETADRIELLAGYRKLEIQLNEAQERVLRVAADAENFKKRLEREKQEQTRYANEILFRDLLPVVDNLERALDHSQTAPEYEGLLEGLTMTLKGFQDTLARLGCTALEPLGETFDPNFHEAVSQVETAEHSANTVVRELQKGYMLKDRLLRPAMVVVAKPPIADGDGAREPNTGGEVEVESSGVKIEVKRG